MHRHSALVLTCAATILAVAPALADKSAATGAELLPAAKISLSAAIAEAEKHVQGKAVDAELEKDGGKAVYEVDVAANGKTFDVTIDAGTGSVMSSKEDKADGEAAKEGDKDD